jgi:hypothetical protein
MEKSRLKKHLKHEAYRNVMFATLGIVAVVAVVIVFGTHILVGFSLLVGKLTGNEEPVTQQQGTSYIEPPTLDPAVEATNSAEITIAGNASPKQHISLYLNGEVVDKTTAKSDRSFEFTNVTLKDGENSLKTKVLTDDNRESDYSNELTISLLKKAPQLTIESPQDGQGYKKEESPIKVSGQTDPGVKVTVNDFRAIVDDQGKYSYL